jgi:polyisoprenoid-binding protein YceI
MLPAGGRLGPQEDFMKSLVLPRSARIALAAVLVLAPTAMRAETLKIDPMHSGVSFTIRHLFTNVAGRFREFEGTIDFDEKNPAASKVSVAIKAASVDTSVEARDKDLRSPNFFDVEKYPTIAFKSTAVTDVSGNKGKVKGLLNIHGVEKEVVLDSEFLGKGKDPWGNTRYGFHGTTRVNRKDFGLTWNKALESGGFLVGDDVSITLDVEAMIPPPPKS